MPKLIRLTTQDDNCIFNNDFKQDILIPPQSKIALQNFCCEVKTGSFNINTTNNEITYTSKDGDATATKTIYLNSGYYDKDNADILFTDIKNKLNASLDINAGSHIGKQWNAEVIDSKVNIYQKLGDKNYIRSDSDVNTVGLNTSVNTYKRQSGTGSGDAFAYINKAFTKGCGRCYITASTFSVVNEGFVFGLTKKKINSSDTVINDNEFFYGIKIYNDSGTMKIQRINNGTTFASVAFVPTAGMTLGVELSQGILELVCYIGTTKYSVHTKEVSYLDDLYPCLVMNGAPSGANNVICSNLKFSNDPFYSDSVSDVETLTAGPPGRTPVGGSYLLFDDSDFSTFLGFSNRRFPKNGFLGTDTIKAVADEEFKPTSLSESFVVELLNINLDSYEAQTKQRRNILSTIVNQQIVNDRVHFVAPYPLYIEMNNANPITLRNIRARILKEDLSEITVNGFSQMTILID